MTMTVLFHPEKCENGQLAFELRDGGKYGIAMIDIDLIALAAKEHRLQEFFAQQFLPVQEAMDQLQGRRS